MSSPFVSSLGRSQGRKFSKEANASKDSLTTHPLLSPPPGAITPGSTKSASGSSEAKSASANPTTNTTTNTNVPIITTNSSSNDPTNANNVNATAQPKYVPYTPRQRASTSVTTQASPTTVTATATTTTTTTTTSSIGSGSGFIGSGLGVGSTGTVGGGLGVTPQLQLHNLKAAAQNAQLNSGSIGWAICEKLYQEGESSEWEDIWSAVITNKATLLLPMDQVTPQDIINPDFVRDHVVYCTVPSNKVVPVVTLSGLRGTLASHNLTFRSLIPTSSAQFQALALPTSRGSTLASLPPLPTPLIVPLKPEYPIFNVPAPHSNLPFPSHPQPRAPARSPLGAGRLNPFASLFGVRASPATTPVALPPTTEELESKSHSVDVNVYVIQGRINRKDVIKEIAAALKAELREALTGVPSWIIERSVAFTTPLHPALPDLKKGSTRQTSISKVVPQLNTTDPTTVSESFQLFYSSLEDELRAQDQKAIETEGKKIDMHDEAAEQRRYQMIERVERTICALFYDQLFRQKSSDDASHDEALSSRIAALNMLDLGLEHLGIDVGKAGYGVQAVVTAVGQTLQKLQDPSCRAPVDKAAVIVTAHNTAVEGLSRLPPIRLKPEDEIEIDGGPTPMAAHFKQNSSSNASPSVSTAASVTLPDVTLTLTALPEEEPTKEDISNSLNSGVDSPSPGLSIQSPSSQQSPPSGLAQSLQTPSLRSPTQEKVPAASPTSLNSPNKSNINVTAPTPVASDILLPLMIYSVVKANPPELVSHLLYVQRYRMRTGAGGEESFCLINLLAVAEFLENVDLAALGLADSARVLSVADLAPLPLSPDPYGDKLAGAGIGRGGPTSPLGTAATLRGRVEQQVEELADSANKVFAGVVDSSFSALKGLLAVGGSIEGTSPLSPETHSPQTQAPWNQRAAFGLLRRGGDTIASMASGLPTLQRVTTGGSRRVHEEGGQMLIEVASRPGSAARLNPYASDESEGEDDDTSEEHSEQESEEGEHAAQEGDADGDLEYHDHDAGDASGLGAGLKSDARSVRSFGSMMSGESRDKKPGIGKGERMSLSDRLASVSVRRRLGKDTSSMQALSPPSRTMSFLGVASGPVPAPSSSRPTSPFQKISPPNERFLECQAEDLRISEVSVLLREYRRVVEGMRALGGFTEE